MSGLFRSLALAAILAGLLASAHTPFSQGPGATTNRMPVPVCPPNDPNACHIDQW